MAVQLESQLSGVGREGSGIPCADMRLLRRVDWRFLLPEPRLERIVYFGPGHDSLLPALQANGRFVDAPRLAAGSLAVPRPKGTYDIAVVQTATRSSLCRARHLLAQDGWLYWELDRRLWIGNVMKRGPGESGESAITSRLSHPAALLRELGYRDVNVHWHFPNFEQCRWIIPVSETPASVYFLGRPQPPLFRSLPGRIAKWLASTDVLARVVPCLSVVARRQNSTSNRCS